MRIISWATATNARARGRVDDAVSKWARVINSLNPNESTLGWMYRVETRAR